MAILRFLLVAVTPAVIFTLPTAAQSGRGTITGTLSDPTGAALQGVRVTLSPSGAQTLTNASGQYTLAGLAAGHYTLTASYSGFADLTLPINILNGQSAKGRRHSQGG